MLFIKSKVHDLYQLFNISKPQFPHLENGDNSTYIMKLAVGINGITANCHVIFWVLHCEIMCTKCIGNPWFRVSTQWVGTALFMIIVIITQIIIITNYNKPNQLDLDLHNNSFMTSPILALKVIMLSAYSEVMY